MMLRPRIHVFEPQTLVLRWAELVDCVDGAPLGVLDGVARAMLVKELSLGTTTTAVAVEREAVAVSVATVATVVVLMTGGGDEANTRSVGADAPFFEPG